MRPKITWFVGMVNGKCIRLTIGSGIQHAVSEEGQQQKNAVFPTGIGPITSGAYSIDLAPVVQRPDNLIQWISHYPTVSICAKISVFHRVHANLHTLTTV